MSRSSTESHQDLLFDATFVVEKVRMVRELSHDYEQRYAANPTWRTAWNNVGLLNRIDQQQGKLEYRRSILARHLGERLLVSVASTDEAEREAAEPFVGELMEVDTEHGVLDIATDEGRVEVQFAPVEPATEVWTPLIELKVLRVIED